MISLTIISILAAADGILEVPVDDRINNPEVPLPKTAFNTLRIIHSNGFETRYLHAKEGFEYIAFSLDKKTECKRAKDKEESTYIGS